MTHWRKLDRVVTTAALALLAGIAFLLWRGDQVGVAILRTAPADGALAAATAPIAIEFGQRMNAASVQEHFSIEPEVPGKFFWNENSMYFLPDRPLEAGEHYLVHLAKGAQGQIGHDLLEDLSFGFEVRQPGIAFLRQAASGYELWALPDLKGAPVQLSPADAVFDFTVSPDGESVIFSVVNDESGIDLWVVGRDGSNPRLLLDCGPDRCFAPDASRTGSIAYSRVPAPLSPAEPYGPPRVWLLDPRRGETVRLHADTQKIGYGPSWSPDARRLAYYNGITESIVVLNVLNGDEFLLPSRAGVMGSWAPDGEHMLYYDTLQNEQGVRNQIFRANFGTQDILPFFDPQPEDADYSGPVVSPDGKWVALKVRPSESGISEQIWVLPPDGGFAIVAVSEGGYLYNNYAWGPNSKSLLYYRIALGTAERQPEAWLWESETGAARLLVENANMPLWLP